MTPEQKQKRLRYLQLKKKKALAMSERDIPVEMEKDSGSFADNLKADAAKQLGNVASLAKAGVMMPKAMLIDAPVQAIKSVTQMASGTPFAETEGGKGFSDAVQTAAQLPGKAFSRAKEIASKRGQAFYEKPITTTLDLAAVLPVAGMALKGAQTATHAVAGAGRSRMGVRALESITGAPRAAIERRLQRPDAVRGAIPAGATETPYAPLADDVAKSVNELGEKARLGAAKAQDTLSSSRYLNDRAIPKDDIVKIVSREKSRLRVGGSVVGESKNAAIARLNKLESQLKKMRGETVSETRVKEIIKSLDPDINWKATENAPTNLALERIRYRFNAKLKKGNQEYREAIAPVARQMRVFKRSQRQFGLEKETGGGFVPSDATASKLKSIGGGKVPMSERRLEQLSKETGRDFPNRAKDIDAALKFEGGATQGSRRVVSFRDILSTIGAGAGGAVGGVPGAFIGGGAGRIAGSILGLITDTSGRKMAGKIIDNYLAVRPNATAQELITANPKLKALIVYSMKDQAPRKALSTYVATRSVPAQDRE